MLKTFTLWRRCPPDSQQRWIARTPTSKTRTNSGNRLATSPLRQPAAYQQYPGIISATALQPLHKCALSAMHQPAPSKHHEARPITSKAPLARDEAAAVPLLTASAGWASWQQSWWKAGCAARPCCSRPETKPNNGTLSTMQHETDPCLASTTDPPPRAVAAQLPKVKLWIGLDLQKCVLHAL